MDAAAAGARERKLRLYTDMTVERIVGGPDIVRPAGVLMPDEKLFVVAVSALGALGPKVDALIDAIAECWFQRGAASSGWRGSRSVGRGDGRCGNRVLGRWPRVCGQRKWWGARAAGTTVKLPQNTDTVGLPLGGCGVDGGQY